MRSVITSVGLATAQGSAADLSAGRPLVPPRPVPWPRGPWSTCGLYRPARDLDPALAGAERWNALARRALAECLGDDPPATGTPLFVASSNGAAADFDAGEWRRSFDTARLLDATPWAGARLPVASAACASGLHALYFACRRLRSGVPERRPPERRPPERRPPERRPPEVVVLAADILPAATHQNFEALRILSPQLEAPWQATTSGFLPGEAAVALRLSASDTGTPLAGPVLGHDLAGDEGLAAALAELLPGRPDLVVGQGTGPFEVDRVELAAIAQAVGEGSAPLTTPLYHFGHTLGASGLLSVALAALAHRGAVLPAFALPADRAADGRPLVRVATPTAARRSLVVCRALGGACAAAAIGDVLGREGVPPLPGGGRGPGGPGGEGSGGEVAPPPLHHPLLRRLAAELPRHRPAAPPDLLLVRLDEPLVPPERAAVGGRILPSAVLEMTPGRLALLAARAWGFQGPALCLVGGAEAPEVPLADCSSVLYISSKGTLHVEGTSRSVG